MRIDQRNAGASVTVNTTGSIVFPVDRFFGSGMTSAGVFTLQRSTTAPTGFTNSMIATVTTADSSIAASDLYYVTQLIEGFNVADLGFGSASAKTVTLSFWVRSSVTGTFSGALANSAYNRSYPFTYTISSANTFEYKTITITGDTSGTWLTDNGIGLRVYWNLGSGVDNTGTAGAWTGAGNVGADSTVALISTVNATFYLSGVQLEVGSVATPFERRPYGTELQLCQRYYQMIVGTSGCPASSTLCDFAIQFPQQMRAAPTCTQAGAVTITDVAASDFAQSSTGFSSVDGPSVYGHHIRLSNFTGLTTFRPYLWRNTNSTNNILLYSAEL